jgi:hypothetical protein
MSAITSRNKRGGEIPLGASGMSSISNKVRREKVTKALEPWIKLLIGTSGEEDKKSIREQALESAQKSLSAQGIVLSISSLNSSFNAKYISLTGRQGRRPSKQANKPEQQPAAVKQVKYPSTAAEVRAPPLVVTEFPAIVDANTTGQNNIKNQGRSNSPFLPRKQRSTATGASITAYADSAGIAEYHPRVRSAAEVHPVPEPRLDYYPGSQSDYLPGPQIARYKRSYRADIEEDNRIKEVELINIRLKNKIEKERQNGKTITWSVERPQGERPQLRPLAEVFCEWLSNPTNLRKYLELTPDQMRSFVAEAIHRDSLMRYSEL